jgi:hypothetical protein
VTASGAQIAGSTAAQDAARDWQALRGDSAIQYAPLPPLKPPQQSEPPEWLKNFVEWLAQALSKAFGPLGEFLGVSWPVMKVIGIALVVLIVLAEEPEWSPDRDAAVALLEDADRLAAEGRYGEAAHLLLQRSVHHIAHARPDWLQPASTAREIAVLPMLPERARRSCQTPAARVERSLFALRDLDAADWQTARSAYADFALQRFQPA